MTKETNYPDHIDTYKFVNAVPRRPYTRETRMHFGDHNAWYFQREDAEGYVVSLLAWDTRSERPAPTKAEAYGGRCRICMLTEGLLHGRISSYQAELGGVIHEVELFNHELFEKITRRPGQSADPQRQIRDARWCLKRAVEADQELTGL